MKKVALGVVALLIVSGAVGALVIAGRRGVQTSSGAAVADGPYASPMPAAYPSDDIAARDAPASFEPEYVQKTVSEQAAAGTTSGGGGVSGEVAAPPSVPTIGPRVIKTANLTVSVDKGSFGDQFDRASLIASKYHGFVVDSQTEGTQAKAGSLVIRVPSASFDQAMSELRGLGEIEQQSVNGTDVTDQFVDLGARLRSWEAQHRVLLRLMDRANSIEETMRVQNEIQRVQFEIEAIKGQLRLLRDQTSLATISLSMHEAGVAAPQGDPSKPSLAQAWNMAVAGFLGVVYAVIVGLGYLIPLGAIGLVVWFAYRRVKPKLAG